MKLNQDFFAEIIRIVSGEIVPPIEAAKNAERLESIQEFFAWLLLRHGFGQDEKELENYLVNLARSTVTKADTRRQQFGFPIEQRQSSYRVADALRQLLEKDCSEREVGENARCALVELSLSARTKLHG